MLASNAYDIDIIKYGTTIEYILPGNFSIINSTQPKSFG